MPFKLWIVIGGLLAALAVAAGAIGAHVLKARPGVERSISLDEAQLATYETAVRYQLFHAVALVIVGLLAAQFPARSWEIAGVLFIVGCVLFSGGLYAWLFSGAKLFVMIVPFGGAAWIAGWIALAIAAWWRC
jgi:uncharacterized membrane protein YgdD (TMEM256/DUF423 family)